MPMPCPLPTPPRLPPIARVHKSFPIGAHSLDPFFFCRDWSVQWLCFNQISFDRAHWAHSGLVCMSTWNSRRIMSERSIIWRMACYRMTSRFFLWCTPNFVSRSSQASSEPLIPTYRLYWDAVQLAVQLALFLFDSHQINSRWRAYLVFLSRFFFCY